MGIGPGHFEQLVAISKSIPDGASTLMLGRQKFRMENIPGRVRKRTNPKIYASILKKHDHPSATDDLSQPDMFAEQMFRGLGYGDVKSLDFSAYENADIVWNLGTPVPDGLKNRFDFIFDGGTLEHVFNIPQAFENIFNMLKVGGQFAAANPYNGFASHGMYQFAPELVWTYWKHSCGCAVHDCFLMDKDGSRAADLPDPKEYGGRLPLKFGPRFLGRIPWKKIEMFYRVEKTAQAHLPTNVTQTDYQTSWDRSGAQQHVD